MSKYKYTNKKFTRNINNKKMSGGAFGFGNIKSKVDSLKGNSKGFSMFGSPVDKGLSSIEKQGKNKGSSMLGNFAGNALSSIEKQGNSYSSLNLKSLANKGVQSIRENVNNESSNLGNITGKTLSLNNKTTNGSNINLLLSEKSKIINQKTAILNEKLSLLNKKSAILNQRLELKKYDKTKYISGNTPSKEINLPIKSASLPPNNHLGGIKNTEMPKDLIGKIKYFFKSDFFYFMKYYLYFIVLFSICFYILMYINQNTNDKMIIVESKIFFYICIVFLFIIINDILESPLESLKQFFLIIIFSLIAVYIVNYFVTKYYKKDDSFGGKLKIIALTTFSIYAITVCIIYFMFQRKNSKVGVELFNAFSFAINKNFTFLVLLTLYLYWYKSVFTGLNLNSSITDILGPSALGGMLILFIFFFIIYLCLKFKIINRINVLNSFIVLLAISFFLGLLCINTFMSSLGTICTTGQQENTTNEQEFVCLLIIASIFTICWYDDVRNWHQTGSIIFIIVTLFALYCMFYYSVKYPSTGLLSFWLFIEWLIIIFYRKQNSKNSLHFSFMKT